MPEGAQTARIVLTTVGNPRDGSRLARTLVEERLAACASMIPAIESTYRWQGNVENASESLLLIKTSTEQLAALEKRLHELHGYETPEFLVLAVEAGSRSYLEWLMESLSVKKT